VPELQPAGLLLQLPKLLPYVLGQDLGLLLREALQGLLEVAQALREALKGAELPLQGGLTLKKSLELLWAPGGLPA
jgi:hypothetical protein